MPRPQVFTQKDTQQGIKLQTTPRDGAEHREGEADEQRLGVQKNTIPTTWYWQGTGLPVVAEKGGVVGGQMLE